MIDFIEYDWWMGDSYSAISKETFSFMSGLVKAEKDAMAKFIDACVAKLNWGATCIDDFAHTGLQLPANGLTKWLTGTSMAIVNAPTHTPGVGYVLNGTTQYIGTTHNCSTFGGHYVQDSAMIGTFLNAYTPDGANASLISLDTIKSKLIDNDGNNRLQWSLNGTTPDPKQLYGFVANKLYTIERTGAAAITLKENGIQIDADTDLSTALQDKAWEIGRRNASTEYLNGTVSSFVVGKPLTDPTGFSDDLATLNTDLAAV